MRTPPFLSQTLNKNHMRMDDGSGWAWIHKGVVTRVWDSTRAVQTLRDVALREFKPADPRALASDHACAGVLLVMVNEETAAHPLTPAPPPCARFLDAIGARFCSWHTSAVIGGADGQPPYFTGAGYLDLFEAIRNQSNVRSALVEARARYADRFPVLTVGDPMPTAAFSSAELTEMDYVGLYRPRAAADVGSGVAGA